MGAIPEAFETFFPAPHKISRPAFDKVFQSAYHLITADVFHFRADRFSPRIWMPSQGDSNGLFHNRNAIAAITIEQVRYIFFQLRAVTRPKCDTFGDFFIRTADGFVVQ